METVKKVVLGCIILLLTSCSSIKTFPVSNTAPAAEITAKIKQDKNKNYFIEVKAKNLASSDRLSPPKNNYSVWLVTKKNGIKNMGQLIIENAKTSKLKTTTPFQVVEIFITAEDQGNLSEPNGIEITRTNVE